LRLASKRFLLASLLFIVTLFIVSLWIPLPKPLVKNPYSTVLLDENDKLLGAKIAKDGQWRFKSDESLNSKYVKAVITFEDKRFFSHFGIDAKALVRALYTDIKHRKIISGGSTITMQLARISQNNQARTILQKLKEMHLALRIELNYSKDEILKMYAEHAPFGGNTVGISSASWRYFGRTAKQLSWAEASLLAVLPNAPSLIHLSRSRAKLKNKRDSLLKKLYNNKVISKQDLDISTLEPLSKKPKPIPNDMNLFMHRVQKDNKDISILKSTINKELQTQVRNVAKSHIDRIANSGIHNLSIIVIENSTMQIKAYVGNQSYLNNNIFANQLDITGRPRSTGSTLKPLLYAKALDSGLITPLTLVEDIPSYYGDYNPTNYDERYRGVVTAEDALIKSLNVPSVRLLQEYGYKNFYDNLKEFGMSTLYREADEYGLSLILGGAETTLYDLSMIYANISSIAQGLHSSHFVKLKVLKDKEDSYIGKSPISQGSAFLTIDAIKKLKRPGIEGVLSSIMKRKEIAWKTGTSYGLRDAWSIGTTPKYTVGVWAGNATGEGSHSLSGVSTAGPVMFDVFSHLEGTTIFEKPADELKSINICKEDGFVATNGCKSIVAEVPKKSYFTKISPYRKLIHLDKKTNLRVHSGCENTADMLHVNYFVLPPNVAYYYNQMYGNYKSLPKYRKDCLQIVSSKGVVEINYPARGHSVYLPQKLDGSIGEVVLKARHRDLSQKLYWHLDDKYIGETSQIHEKTLFIKAGKHRLLVMDMDGNREVRVFNVLSKDGSF